jgi:phage shock protein A
MKGNTMKQSIFGRMAQLAKANINSLLDQAEDPQKMLDQMVRDYTNNIAEAEAAVAQTIGNLRMLQDDYNEDIKNAQDWGNKALAASSLDAQFNSLEDLGEQTEIEARLAALKSGGSPAAIGAGEGRSAGSTVEEADFDKL